VPASFARSNIHTVVFMEEDKALMHVATRYSAAQQARRSTMPM